MTHESRRELTKALRDAITRARHEARLCTEESDAAVGQGDADSANALSELAGDWIAVAEKLDQGIVNGKAREVTLSRFAPVARVKIRP
jgi:hypothetical protein